MISFELDNLDVGRRTIEAIQRAAAEGEIQLTARAARFRAPVDLRGITFAGVDLTGALFDHGVTLAGGRSHGDLILDRVVGADLALDDMTIEGSLFARGARLASFLMRNCVIREYASLDEASFDQISVRDVSFGAELRCRGSETRARGTFRRVAFSGVVSLQRSSWGSLRLAACTLGRTLELDGAASSSDTEIIGCRLEDSRQLRLVATRRCSLRESVFVQPVSLRVEAADVDCTATLFERGVDLSVDSGATLALEAASILGSSIVTTHGDGGGVARVVSIEGMRGERLTLRDLDLSNASFTRAHTLDQIVISGRGQLPLSRQLSWTTARREVIRDELLWRERRGRRTGGASQDETEALTIAETYRALRRGREESRDRPGAADFYYGEMEMRRHSRSTWVDRWVLTAYWLTSGYGLRASRALLAYVVTVLTLSALLDHCGLEKGADFTDVVAYVLATTTVLARPASELALNTFGAYVQVGARILGPALFALMLLALRSRVRR